MPSVPRRDGRVGTAPLPGVRVSPDAPAAAFRQPEGVDISPVTKQVAALAARERDTADQLALLDADNQLAQLSTDLTLKAQQRQGKDALGATTEVEADWQKGVSEIEKTLTNERQRFAFQNRAGGRWQSIYATVERHAANEVQKYDAEVTETAVKSRINDALTNFRDPQEVAKAALELRAVIRDHGRRNGWAPEVIEEKAAANLSRLHAGVISRFLHVGDDRAATAYYEKAKGQIIGEHAENIDQALQEGSTVGEAQRQADSIIKTKGVTRTDAYEQARAIEDPKVRRATEQELDTQYSRQERAQREAHDDLLNRAGEYADRGERPPATLLARMKASERRTLENYRRSVVRGEQIQTDQAAYYELRDMATDPKKRDGFAKLNLLTYRDRLSNSDFQEMAGLQMSVRKKGDEAVRGFMTDAAIVNNVVDQSGLFPKAGKVGGQKDDVAVAQFRREIDIAIADEKQRTGKETLPSEAVQKITDGYVLRRRFAKGDMGTEDRDNAEFQYLTADRQGRAIVPTERILDAERNAIAAILRRAGSTVSTSKVERMYAAHLLRDRALFDAIAAEP